MRSGPSGLTLFPLGNRSLRLTNESLEYESEVRFIYLSHQLLRYSFLKVPAYNRALIAY
jgi:hypothetical protein